MNPVWSNHRSLLPYLTSASLARAVKAVPLPSVALTPGLDLRSWTGWGQVAKSDLFILANEANSNKILDAWKKCKLGRIVLFTLRFDDESNLTIGIRPKIWIQRIKWQTVFYLIVDIKVELFDLNQLNPGWKMINLSFKIGYHLRLVITI